MVPLLEFDFWQFSLYYQAIPKESMNIEACNRFDRDGDRRLWKTKLQISDDLDMKEIPSSKLRDRLGLQGPNLEEVYRSTRKNQWFDCDDGNFLIEIPNKKK